MLTVKTTPHMYGISLQGDYTDLNSIYDALSRYLEFYQEHTESFPYHEYEYLLSLNYDIRHAWMGTRDHVVIENNADEYGRIAEGMYSLPEDFKKEISGVRKNHKHGNLYFSVNILYPLAFHYLVSLERILDDYYLPSWFEMDEKEKDAEDDLYHITYDKIMANHDRAQIRLLTSLLWDNLTELFGSETALEAYAYFVDQEYGFTHSLYIDALLHHMMVCFEQLNENERKNYLYLTFMEILDTEDLRDTPTEFPECYQRYRKTLAAWEKVGAQKAPANKKEFPTQHAFYREFNLFTNTKKPLYQDDFDQFLENQYGIASDDEPDW